MRKIAVPLFKTCHWAALLALLALLVQPALYAQMTGTITGTVFDSTGAVVPKANVTLINEATKDSRSTVSNGEGYFTFASVAPGNYTVKVEAQNFRSWEQKTINVMPGDKKHLGNIALAVGVPSETITVEATASMVQVVDSGERSATLSANAIEHLALQGRDATELLKTLPGFNMQTSAGGDNTGAIGNRASYDPTVVGIGSAIGNGFNSNGLGRNGQDLFADGAHVIDPGCNCNATQTVNGDMVAEVKVSTSNFGAEASKGPVLVSAVGKSGTSSYHGEAYLHLRDAVMNANDWNDNHLGLARQDNRYLYPGGQFGGPIPRTKKAFFFFGYELYRQTFPDPRGTLEAVVPTQDMRTGNFDATSQYNKPLCSVLQGWQPQCGNVGGTWVLAPGATTTTSLPAGATQLPQQYWDAGGMAILNLIPMPNYTPTTDVPFNFVQSITSSRNGGMLHGRVDYNFNDNTKLFVSYNWQTETDADPVMLWWQPPQSVPYPADMGDKPVSHTLSGNLVHVFSPSLTNEMTASLAFLRTGLTYGNEAAVSRAALGYPYKGIFKNGSDILPSLTNGWWIPGYPMMYEPQANNYKSIKFLPNFSDTLTKVIRTHTVKAGVYLETTQNNQNAVDNLNGRVQFAPGTTDNTIHGTIGSSNPIAAMMMGVVGGDGSYYETNSLPSYGMTYKTVEGFVQDSWKLSRRFTLDLGLRLSHLGEWEDMNGNGAAVFSNLWYNQDMSLPTAARPAFPGMRWHAIDPSIPLSGRPVKPVFMSPRFGMAWDLFGTGNSVLRGGLGMYRFRDQWNTVEAALGPSSGFRSITLANRLYLADIDNIAASGSPSAANALSPSDSQMPLTYSYSLTLSQKMPWSTMLEVAYVGNQSTHLSTYNAGNKLDNLNIIPLGAYFGPDVNGHVVQPNAAPSVDLSDPNCSSPNWWVVRWNCNPVVKGVNDPLENIDPGKYRPYQAYAGGALNVFTHRAYQNYNGLQVSWNRQKGAFFWGLNYTFSKNLGVNRDTDPRNLDANYGIMGQLDRTHVFNASYSFDIGNHAQGNKILGAVVDGWTISGTTSFQSGIDLWTGYGAGLGIGLNHATNCDSGIVDPRQTFDDSGAPGTMAHINIECLPQWDNKTLLGTPDYQLLPRLLCDPASSQYINGNCFGVPVKNLTGTAALLNALQGPVNVPYLHGPSFFNSDLSLAKNFKITERQTFQFRAAAFNFLNHGLTSFDSNNTDRFKLNYSLQQSGQFYNATGNHYVLPSGFGTPATKYGRRVVELSLKYTF